MNANICGSAAVRPVFQSTWPCGVECDASVREKSIGVTHHLTIRVARGCIAEPEESLAKGAGAGLLLLLLSLFSRVQLCATLWTVACQALLSMEFPSQEYWSGGGLHFLPQGIFLTQGSNLLLLHRQASLFTSNSTREA